MKRILLLLSLLMPLALFSQVINRTFQDANGSLVLLGRVTTDRLADDPFASWFNENHSSHNVDEQALDGLSSVDSITLFMGTWCGDSRREVPRFIKILESQDFDLKKLNIICVNRGFQNYKQAPDREERGFDIYRVPTFIFHGSDGKELGRIVEEPVETLEKDLQKVLAKGEYHTAYPIAERVRMCLKEKSLEELRQMEKELISELSGGTNPYELNTYAYMLWTSFQIPKAQFVFELNAALFPEEVAVYRSLATFLDSLGQDKAAADCVEQGLKSNPENEQLLALKEAFAGR